MQDFAVGLATKLKELSAYLCQWPVIAFVGVIVGSHVFFWVTCAYLDAHDATWYLERHPLPPVVDMCAGPPASPPCVRLLEQMDLADHRAAYHFKVMRLYQSRYFGLLATAYCAGTLAAALLVMVVKQGWDATDDRVRGLFLGLSTVAAFFGGFPALIQASENATGNEEAYLKYDNLSTEIRSFVVAGDRPEVDAAAFVHEVDGNLAELNHIYADLDESKVNLGRTLLLESTGSSE